MPVSLSPARHQRYVEIEFAPTSGCLGSVVALVTEFCRNVVDDAQIRFAFQLAAYELTENLVKYSTGATATLRIEVVSSPRGPEIVMTTENESNRERLTDVASRMDALESASDPTAHFDQLVQESLLTPSESRLGLGRLRAEGELHVSHRITEERLTVQVRRSARAFEESKTK